MGLGDQSLTLFIVDFGLAKRYRYPATGNHIPFRQVYRMRGTPAFSSIHNHLGAELGRRDDLESLAYMLIYLVRGSLPWLSEDKCQKASSILEMKQKTAVEVLCRHVPCELGTFLTYTRTLSFLEEPDYSYIRSLFSTLGRETSGPEHDLLLDLLPLEPVSLPASPSLESSPDHMPTPPPALQRPRTTRRRKATGTESTPCHKSSRVAQQHQPGSTKITPRLPKHRYASMLFKLSNSDYLSVFSLQSTTPHLAPVKMHTQFGDPGQLVDHLAFSEHAGIGRIGGYGHTLYRLLYVVHGKILHSKDTAVSRKKHLAIY